MTDFTFKIPLDLLNSFRDICKPKGIAMSKILRALIKLFLIGQIKIEDLDLED